MLSNLKTTVYNKQAFEIIKECTNFWLHGFKREINSDWFIDESLDISFPFDEYTFENFPDLNYYWTCKFKFVIFVREDSTGYINVEYDEIEDEIFYNLSEMKSQLESIIGKMRQINNKFILEQQMCQIFNPNTKLGKELIKTRDAQNKENERQGFN